MGDVRLFHDGSPLHATVPLPGGKHAFAHSLACAALADEGNLQDVPDHVDARALRDALSLVFDHVAYDSHSRHLRFSAPRTARQVTLDEQLVSRSRSLFCLIPALLTRADEVRLAGAPQGCAIGSRPYDWYVAILRQFGVQTRYEEKTLVLTWADRRPALVEFAYPSMTGTVIAIAAAAAAPGRSVIRNASVEPSCDEQVACLRAMGVPVAGTLPELEITGGARCATVSWRVACDRIHAVTLLTAGLLTRGAVTVTSGGPLRVPRFVEFLRRAGAQVTDDGEALTAAFPTDRGRLDPVETAAGSEPLFSSDWVPFAALLLSLRSHGKSVLTDDVFLDRFQFTDNLRPHGLRGVRLGRGDRKGRATVIAEIDGAPAGVLTGGNLGHCPDIRGSAALLLAGLAADGPVVLENDFHLRRGYTDLPADLRRLGVTAAEALTRNEVPHA
ncbi:hypothetical protein ACWDR5_28000 [Streptomyces koyangensis]